MDAEPLTQLLRRAHGGDVQAADELFSAVYEDLYGRAAKMMRGQPSGHTLQPTAVVNEAWLRLGLDGNQDWQDRRHFLAVASKAMRSVLVDHARARKTQRRGGHRQRVDWTDGLVWSNERSFDLLALDEALTRFGELDPALSQLVELRFFGGLTIAETAEVLGMSTATVERGWRTARLWLRAELEGAREDEG